MAPVGPVVHQNVATKAKRPIPPGIQTNGVISSSKSSPSPSMSAKKPPSSAKQPPHSASERAITASTVRPINRARRETASQLAGRHSRNSAGLRSASMAAETTSHDAEPPPYVVTDNYILKKFAGRPPSLIIHMHPTHFRFDNQDGMFPYKSPMKLFLDHIRSRTVPHDLLQYLTDAGVPFYEGCLIVQVHDHKSVAQAKDVSKPAPAKGSVVPSSIHNYNQYLTPSPFVPFPKESLSSDGNAKGGDSKDKPAEEKKESTAAAPAPEDVKGKTTKPKVFTVVLHPTALSLQMDLLIKGSTPKDSDGISAIPPPTPMSIVPPTPTATSMPPPAKRQKREKTELDGSNIHAAEGQILLATTAPLMLEPTKNIEETIVLLEAMSHPKHSEAPPQPKTRKRTVAEVAADEAAAAEEERYMLFGDERLSSSVAGAQNGGAADGDASGGAAFEPRFERFKVLADIKREHAEKKEQEKLKQQENDRRLQQQRQQQQQEAVMLAQRQAAEQERTRREARETQLRQAEAQRQAQARAAAATPSNQNNARPNVAQPQHAHPQNNTMANGVTNAANGATPNAVANNPQNQAQAQAQPRFQAQISQPPASSPVARQGTPQNMSSPMVASVPMQQTNSGMAVSPPRPASVVQNAPMSVPMAHNMSSRGSQQSHPSGTPRIPHSTPNISHGTPINRPAMTSTPRMTQASPPPNMMAQNSQMGQAMMMNNQGMNQANQQAIAQVAAHQRAIAQQQHMAAMQNGVNNGNINGQMSPQQQQQMMQMMQRQLLMQQQAQQSQGQHQQAQQGNMMTQQLAQQYAQQIQNMSGNQMRQMTPQMQAQFQQMMRMQQQVNGQMGNNMQGQVNGQMMNGNNVNIQALQAMQQQQAQRQAQQQQAQQQQQQAQQQQQQNQQQPQQGQQQMGNNPIQTQIQHNARVIYHQLLQQAILKHGSQDRIPAEINEKLKQTSISRAQNLFQQGMIQRRNQQQLMMQQQQQQQMQQMQQQQMQQQQLQQQQQMQQMQGMNNMMGPQGGM